MQRLTTQNRLVTHLFAAILFFAPFVLLYGLRNDALLLFILGVLIGTFLPGVDQLIYALYYKPNDLTSQRVRAKFKAKSVLSGVTLLLQTRDERQFLIFHTIFFQCIFLVFSFLLVTSTANVFGQGLVLSFLLSLLVSQFLSLRTRSSMGHWFYLLPYSFTELQLRRYLYIQLVLLVLLTYIF